MPVIPVSWELDIGRSQFKVSSKELVKLKEQLNVLGHAYNPSYAEGIGRRIML